MTSRKTIRYFHDVAAKQRFFAATLFSDLLIGGLLFAVVFLASDYASPRVTRAQHFPGQTLDQRTLSISLQSPVSPLRVGWAYEAYPDLSFAQMLAAMTRMRDAGANAVWFGHNNPGEVDAEKIEPGLSYAVYEAFEDNNDPRHGDARRMADAVRRALKSARAVGLKVVLPIGYQIMMGTPWNERNPDALRRTSEGQPLQIYDSGVTASPYAEQYRSDIRAYYEWVEHEWVEPYRDVIVMLSLADEPMGGDYSAAAAEAFAERYGEVWDKLESGEEWKLGEFQAGVIADYAAWSAQTWREIDPNVLTTMSFHGGDTARRVWGLPEIERLFAETPENFIITFDAYLHDDLPAKPATSAEAAELKLFLKTLGFCSKVYHKPLALWSGANAWGLAQESSAPLGIPDVTTNLMLLDELPQQMGGEVWGVFAWNYNLKGQGLYNYNRSTTYESQAVEIAVSRAFTTLLVRKSDAYRAPLDAVVIVSPRPLYDALAHTRASDVPPPWFDASPYANLLADRNAAIITNLLGLDMAREARYFIVTSPSDTLDASVVAFLKARAQEGRVLMVDRAMAQAVSSVSQDWSAGWESLPAKGGVYVVERGTTAQ